MVTHLTTSPPVEGLTYGDQTGSSFVIRLWSYVEEIVRMFVIDVRVVMYLTWRGAGETDTSRTETR